MCARCQGPDVLRRAGLAPTRNRLAVLAVLATAGGPMAAREVEAGLQADTGAAMNRVTVYRILELLAESGVLTRLACPDRVDRYCLGASPLHPEHAHFYCQSCGSLSCLRPDGVRLEADRDPSCGRVETAQVLLAGTCRACLRQG